MPELTRAPTYTILLPLYREANVIPELFRAVARLEYPSTALQVLIIVEDDDGETGSAAEQHAAPDWTVVRVPAGEPRTKPRALNHALPLVGGEFLTIYDAEDRPATTQLHAAWAAFESLPHSVASLQARLDFYNPRQNVLTRWFTCDYAMNFGLHLPGIERLGHAMPLGGTSTHFRTHVVRLSERLHASRPGKAARAS
jgi:cellulose synthase/poly-beta-1,6-N-acetylglucosamine synthase-like glycosyltransferase